MKALVVYDSVFGNTEKVAQAIGEALAAQAEVQTLGVGSVKPEHLAGMDTLIVGSPTRAFRPTPAITTWLKGLPSGSLQGVKVAAFDTRIAAEDTNSGLLKVMVKLFGYAARPIGSRLTQKGGDHSSVTRPSRCPRRLAPGRIVRVHQRGSPAFAFSVPVQKSSRARH
jgi:flavodoxin